MQIFEHLFRFQRTKDRFKQQIVRPFGELATRIQTSVSRYKLQFDDIPCQNPSWVELESLAAVRLIDVETERRIVFDNEPADKKVHTAGKILFQFEPTLRRLRAQSGSVILRKAAHLVQLQRPLATSRQSAHR